MATTAQFFTEEFVDREKDRIYEERFEGFQLMLNIKGNQQSIKKLIGTRKENVDWCDDPHQPVGKLLSVFKDFDEGAGVLIFCQNETQIDKLLAGDIRKVFSTKPLWESEYGPGDDESVSKIGDTITW